MMRGSYRAVVELLTPVGEDPSAASLLFLLEDARNHLQSLQRDIDAALYTVEVLTGQEYYAEAIKFLETQTPAVVESEPVQTALERLRAANDREMAALQAVGKAYAALDRFDVDAGSLQDSGASSESLLLTRIVPVFTSRRQSVAERQLSSAIEQARAAIEAGDRKQAALALKDAKCFAEYAGDSLQNEWQSLLKKTEKGKMFGRRG
jgi:hypothetical protein